MMMKMILRYLAKYLWVPIGDNDADYDDYLMMIGRWLWQWLWQWRWQWVQPPLLRDSPPPCTDRCQWCGNRTQDPSRCDKSWCFGLTWQTTLFSSLSISLSSSLSFFVFVVITVNSNSISLHMSLMYSVSEGISISTSIISNIISSIIIYHLYILFVKASALAPVSSSTSSAASSSITYIFCLWRHQDQHQHHQQQHQQHHHLSPMYSVCEGIRGWPSIGAVELDTKVIFWPA